MSPVRHIRRLTGVLAGLAGALLAFAAAAPAAFASGQPPRPPGWNKHPPLPPGHIHYPVHRAPVPVPVHTVVAGGMPGWQIALIAAGAALLAAIAAVVLHRAWAARGKTTIAGDLPALGGFAQAGAEQVVAGELPYQAPGIHLSDRGQTAPPTQATPR